MSFRALHSGIFCKVSDNICLCFVLVFCIYSANFSKASDLNDQDLTPICEDVIRSKNLRSLLALTQKWIESRVLDELTKLQFIDNVQVSSDARDPFTVMSGPEGKISIGGLSSAQSLEVLTLFNEKSNAAEYIESENRESRAVDYEN